MAKRAQVEWTHPWSADEGAARARTLFQSAYGSDASGVWSAPGRVNVIGEHTDYSRGLCLPSVLPHRTYVAGRVRNDGVVRLTSSAFGSATDAPAVWELEMDEIDSATARGWTAYPAGVLWALRERGFDGAGMDLAFVSCVPLGAGLSSSAAIEVATALAANDMWGLALDTDAGRLELAEACVEAENVIAGAPTGGLDQHTALRCPLGHALQLDFSTSPPEGYLAPMSFAEYGLTLLIIDTKVPHDLTDGRYETRRTECEQAAAALDATSLREVADDPFWLRRLNALEDPLLKKRARHVVTEIHRVRDVTEELNGTGPAHDRFFSIGALISQSHTSLALDFDVSCKELDLAVDAALEAGALGARMVGGGFGGSALALLRTGDVDRAANAIVDRFIAAAMRPPQFIAL